MIEDYLQKILFELNYFEIFVLVFVYFLFLYFILAPTFKATCQFLERKNILNKIIPFDPDSHQIKSEIKNSFSSILIFGFSGIPIIYLIRNGPIDLLENSFYNIALGVIILTLWNEIHFFVVHRIMHLPFFMRNVHFVHHQSKIPSVYSVYSFHWLEAFLLSTVPVTIIPFVPVAPLVLLFYPLSSVLFNYAGHCNYRIGNSKGPNWTLFATHHNEHHFKFRKNYGFALNIFDKIHNWFIPSKNNK
jgi:Delta7-sterol 5-desaturase